MGLGFVQLAKSQPAVYEPQKQTIPDLGYENLFSAMVPGDLRDIFQVILGRLRRCQPPKSVPVRLWRLFG